MFFSTPFLFVSVFLPDSGLLKQKVYYNLRNAFKLRYISYCSTQISNIVDKSRKVSIEKGKIEYLTDKQKATLFKIDRIEGNWIFLKNKNEKVQK